MELGGEPHQILQLQGLYERVPGGELDPAVSGRPAVGARGQLQVLDLKHRGQAGTQVPSVRASTQ